MVTPQRDKTAAPLLAVYDLAVSPLTFDILLFLTAAEIARLDCGAPAIHFVLVPPGDARAYGNLGIASADNLAWRSRQITLAATALMPSVMAISVCSSRATADDLLSRHAGPRYPEYYSVGRPVAGFTAAETGAAVLRGDDVPSLGASPQALAYADNWLRSFAGGKRPVSITLREADNAAAKNSNLDLWASFIASLDREIYFPFVIRDTDRVFETTPAALGGVAQFALAAVNLELRAAIYERSYLNLIGSNGATGLCLFDRDIRALIFNIGVPGWSDTTPEAFRQSFGIEPGMQLHHTQPHQRMVWGAESLQSIQRHFDLMARYIDGGARVITDPAERDFLMPEIESAEVFAERVFTHRQWGPSKTIFRHLLATQPDNAEWLYRLGVAETWAGNPRRGLELLQKALDLGLTSAELYLARCEASTMLDRPEQAIANARYALELDPDSFDAAMRLGVLFESSGRFADACGWLEQAVALRPDQKSAQAYLDLVRSRLDPVRT